MTQIKKLAALKRAVTTADAKHDAHVERASARVESGDIRGTDVLKVFVKYRESSGQKHFGWSMKDQACAKKLAESMGKDVFPLLDWLHEKWPGIKAQTGVDGQPSPALILAMRQRLYDMMVSGHEPAKRQDWKKKSADDKVRRVNKSEWDDTVTKPAPLDSWGLD